MAEKTNVAKAEVTPKSQAINWKVGDKPLTFSMATMTQLFNEKLQVWPWDKRGSRSAMIRYLIAAFRGHEYVVARVSDVTNLRYQHVRNVHNMPLKGDIIA